MYDLTHLALVLAGVVVAWVLIVWELAKLEPPCAPVTFGAQCRCGHAFADHHSDAHGMLGVRCDGCDETACNCTGFEPSAKVRG